MATAVLPEVVALCINSALKSGRNLSWKIQHSLSGTSVQLFWKSDRDYGGGQLGDTSSYTVSRRLRQYFQEKRKSRALPIETESKTSQKLQVLKRKSEVGSSRLLDNPEA